MNNYCFECSNIDPAWVSINNGLFICVNCIGNHRGFGVEISQTKSLQLDTIDALQLKMLKTGGNRKFLQMMELY